MKVFLLCVDALELDFVKYRDYQNIKQEHYFKIPIPKRCLTIFENGHLGPFTPVMWQIIFTGKIKQNKPEPKPPKAHWRSNFLNKVARFKLAHDCYSRLIRHRLLPPGFPTRFGFERRDPLRGDHTIISHAKNPIVIHNPLKADVKWQAAGLHSGLPFSEIAKEAVDTFRREEEATLNRISDDWDLFMVYTKLLDTTGHLFWQIDSLVETYYSMVDVFAGKIKTHLPTNTSMAVISDHGMMPLHGTKRHGGEHSHHAFASFNQTLPVRSLEITDLHDLIVSAMDG